ncbi:ubiquinone/menaquinone biosynthesis methyltransferase [Candidatus Saganbacteria bacterium]|nr:ubiquinone/menaquinone biosynthesis methyltransferase [Candidatus Saganbacteria bacterium]
MNHNKALIRPDENKVMFDNISARYDFLNKILSFGSDRSWRIQAVDRLNVKDGGLYIDAGCGTADLAIEVAHRLKNNSGQVLGIDHSNNMLSVGRKKVTAAKLDKIISLFAGDALKLPQADATVDGLVSGFVIRNIDNRLGALKEWMRVLKPGGHCVILELSQPDNLFFLAGYKFFTNLIVPFLSLFLSKYKPYKYLIDSIKSFPPAPVFMEMMRKAGFQQVEMKSMTFGVVKIYISRGRQK